MSAPEAFEKYIDTHLAFISATLELHSREKNDPTSREARRAREQWEARRAGLLLRVENLRRSVALDPWAATACPIKDFEGKLGESTNALASSERRPLPEQETRAVDDDLRPIPRSQ